MGQGSQHHVLQHPALVRALLSPDCRSSLGKRLRLALRGLIAGLAHSSLSLKKMSSLCELCQAGGTAALQRAAEQGPSRGLSVADPLLRARPMLKHVRRDHQACPRAAQRAQADTITCSTHTGAASPAWGDDKRPQTPRRLSLPLSGSVSGWAPGGPSGSAGVAGRSPVGGARADGPYALRGSCRAREPRQSLSRPPGPGSAEPEQPPVLEGAPRSSVPAEVPSLLPARTRKRKRRAEAA